MQPNKAGLVAQPPALGYRPDVALVNGQVQVNPTALGVPGYYNLGVTNGSNSIPPQVPVPQKKPSRLMNSVRGALYDMQHWDELPAEGTKETLSFVCTRDNRLPYLIMFITIIVFLIALLGVVISFMVKGSNDKPNYPMYPPYPMPPLAPIQ
ncbi:MAG: hypothetical protein K0U52_04590 [Gammaproteobacteria bacterium]|nr:hypothetical protein [Gammaproteobacteria bacterium]